MSKKSKKKKSNPNVQRGSNKNFKPVKQITPIQAEPENKVEQDVEDEVTKVEADEVITPIDPRETVVLTTGDDEDDVVVEEPKRAEEKASKDNIKQKSKKPAKEKKKFGRRTKETFSELKKVSWPTFKEVVKKTGVVLAVVIFFALVLFGVDRLLSLLYGLFTAGL
ncbi:MAG: preprotein translocase subunit SecE [Clostridia bacterium]|nr:preprotein translocase subunit SecE [Clostridia bacterium]